jgi:hypothetical protein
LLDERDIVASPCRAGMDVVSRGEIGGDSFSKTTSS